MISPLIPSHWRGLLVLGPPLFLQCASVSVQDPVPFAGSKAEEACKEEKILPEWLKPLPDYMGVRVQKVKEILNANRDCINESWGIMDENAKRVEHNAKLAENQIWRRTKDTFAAIGAAALLIGLIVLAL